VRWRCRIDDPELTQAWEWTIEAETKEAALQAAGNRAQVLDPRGEGKLIGRPEAYLYGTARLVPRVPS
jgi:plasmid stabilization system protein ParE